MTITDDMHLTVSVYTCEIGKAKDPNFEPDVTYVDPIETKTKMAQPFGYTVYSQRVNTNFVPSTYHASQQL